MSASARFITIAAMLASALPAAARPSLDTAGLQRLDRWEVLVFSDPWRGGIERGKAIGVFSATPEEVYRVATEYAKYQDFMPRVRQSSVASRDKAETLVDLTADLPWPAGRSKVTARYTTEKLPGDIYRIRFQMIRGEMRQYVGQLYIEPWAPGRTAVTYEIVAEPNVWAPRSTINKSIRNSAGGYVHALRQRVNDLHLAGYLHPQAPPAKSGERAPLVGAPLKTHSVKAQFEREPAER
jgi:ribosome-associated toxin RatA of RatAB toxin-antitoxin module